MMMMNLAYGTYLCFFFRWLWDSAPSARSVHHTLVAGVVFFIALGNVKSNPGQHIRLNAILPCEYSY